LKQNKSNLSNVDFAMVHKVEDGKKFLLFDAFQVQKRILLGFAVWQDSPEERGASCQEG